MKHIFLMKRLFALLCVALFALSLFSCNPDSDDDDTSSANTQTNSSTTSNSGSSSNSNNSSGSGDSSNSNSSSSSGNSENSSGSDNGGSSSSGTTTPDTTQETTADDTEDLSNAGSSSVTLPESSGENPFLNKTFKSNNSASLAFGSSYVTTQGFLPGLSFVGGSAIFSYSYDDNKGLLYLKLLKWGDNTSVDDFVAEYHPESNRVETQESRDALQSLFNTLIVYEAYIDGTTLHLNPYLSSGIVFPSAARFSGRTSLTQDNLICQIQFSYGIRITEERYYPEYESSYDTGIEYYAYPTFNGDTFSGTLYKHDNNLINTLNAVTKIGSISGTWSSWSNADGWHIQVKFTSIDCDLVSTDEEYRLEQHFYSGSEYFNYTLEE